MIGNTKSVHFFRAVLSRFALLLLAFLACSAPLTAPAADPFVGNIKSIEKESPVLRVRILRGGKTDGPAAVEGDAVFLGDSIRTDEGVRIQVDLSDGSNIFIGPGSNVQMKNFMVNPSQGKRQMAIKALQGTIRFLVAKLFRNKASGSETPWTDSGVTIETLTAIAGVKGTDFAVTIEADDVEIAVFEGVVSVKSADASVRGEIMLASNQVSRVMQGARPSAPVPLTPQMRDRLLRSTTPAKVMIPAVAKAAPGPKKDRAKGTMGIARDLAAGVPLKEIMLALVKEGVSIQAIIAAAVAEGVDPSHVVFTAISEGYPAQVVVAAALKTGAVLDAVVNSALGAGADKKSIYVGGADAGAPPAAITREISSGYNHAKIIARGAKAGAGPKKDRPKGSLGIARDLAAGVPLKDIMLALVMDGVSIQEVIAAAIAEGVSPGNVVATAISEGYASQVVVTAAVKAGAPLDIVVNAAIAAGADKQSIYAGAADAGAPPAAVANEIATATAPGAPVYGYTAPTEAQPSVYTPPPPISVGGGGGATPSTKPASPYKP